MRLKILYIAVFFVCSSSSVFSQPVFEEGGLTYRIIKEADESSTFGTVVVSENPDGFYEGTITIPNAIQHGTNGYADTYKVVGIDAYAFKGSPDLTRVILPVGIETIGDGAFWGCTKLVTVEIPSGSLLSSMGECVFQESGLQSIEIHGCISELPRMTFMNCKKLKEVILPETLKIIGVSAFIYCESLTHLLLPKSLSEIKTCAFAYSGLKEISLPPKVTNIPMSAFQMCKSLSKVELSQYTTTIGPSAFSCNFELADINILQYAENIDPSAFDYCPKVPDAYVSPEKKAYYEQIINSGAFD